MAAITSLEVQREMDLIRAERKLIVAENTIDYLEDEPMTNSVYMKIEELYLEVNELRRGRDMCKKRLTS